MFKLSAKSLNYRQLLSAAIMLCMSFSLLAGNGTLDKGLTKEEAIADLNFYFKVIDKQHGNPYLYISRDNFQTLIAEKIATLPEQVSYKELSNVLVELNQQIRCGHTNVSISKDLMESAAGQPEFFPYPVSIIDGELYIDFEDGTLPHASKITSLNGMDATKVLRELSLLPTTDGFIETKVKRDIEKKFGYYFFLRYGPYNTFRVGYEGQNGELSEADVAGNTVRKMLTNNYYRPVYKSHERYIHFTHLDAIDSLHTLVLTLNTFKAHPEWFYKRIMSSYDEDSKTFDFDNLVIDLRNNEGGDRRLLNILYQLVAGKALSDPSVNSARSLEIAQDQLQGINGAAGEAAVTKAEDYLSERFVNRSEGKFETERLDWYSNEFKLDMDLSQLRFTGQVYLLTSGRTYSAAADIARIFSQLDNVKLVGEETGGGHESRTANMLLSYKLPNTNMDLQVPVIYEQFLNADSDNGKGRGTFPDYFVTQTYQDLLSGTDTAFEFTLDLIQQHNSLGSN